MKRNTDDLLRLAFGELSDDAARLVESRADAADRAEIDAYRALHAGLQHLPPPPPDGLSPERLRAAILDRELKARRTTPFWGSFLFAPAALAALAAVVILPRLRPHADPQTVAIIDPKVEDGLQARDLRLTPPTDAISSPAAGLVVNKATPALRAEPVPSRLTARRVRSRRAAAPTPVQQREDIVAFNGTPDEGGAPAMLAAVKRPEPPTIDAPASSVVEGPGNGIGATETVVMVSSKRDLDTGALAATEKEVKDVFVGG